MSSETLPTEIVVYPDPRLRQTCVPIETFDGELEEIARHMFATMHEHNGVGLAGPQIGINRQIFVWNPTGEPENDRVFLNPRLSELVGAVTNEEGCLSLPDIHVEVRRARRCRIDACDLTGQSVAMEGEDLVARIWQHETDHLNGTLIIDRMNPTDKIANKYAIADLEARYRRRK